VLSGAAQALDQRGLLRAHVLDRGERFLLGLGERHAPDRHVLAGVGVAPGEVPRARLAQSDGPVAAAAVTGSDHAWCQAVYEGGAAVRINDPRIGST
jgi:hypothetical protein